MFPGKGGKERGGKKNFASSVVNLSADLRNVCSEAGMFAIRAGRDYVINEDMNKAVRKIAETKKLEGNVKLYSDQ